jgi:hypothetical protein
MGWGHGFGVGFGPGPAGLDEDAGLEGAVDILMFGKISELDPENKTLTIAGTLFRVTDSTSLTMGPEPAEFDDLAVGQTVRVAGAEGEDATTALGVRICPRDQ